MPNGTSLDHYQTLESSIIFKNPWIEVYQDRVKTPCKQTMLYTWYRSSDVVLIIPFISSKTMVMINQYRYPLRKVLLEFPAGHIEQGEEPRDTAIRELQEETGYTAKKVEYVYHYHPSVSKSKQTVYVFRATGLAKGAHRHDSTEDIEIVKVSISKLKRLIAEKKVENAATLIAYLLCCAKM